MRIGILSTCYPRHRTDFAGRFVADLAHQLRAGGDRLEIIAPAPAADPLVTVLPIGNPASQLFFGGGAPDNLLSGPPLRRLRAAGEIVPFCGSLAAHCWSRAATWDAVISHWLIPCGVIAARCTRGRPHLAIAHSSDVHLLQRLSATPLALRLLARARSRLVVTSPPLLDQLQSAAHDRATRQWLADATIVRMGYYPQDRPNNDAIEQLLAHHRVPGDRPLVIYLGRLIELKGVDLLLRAWHQLRPQATLVIIGEGPARSALQQLAQRLSVAVHFVGTQLGRDKQHWLAAAQIAVVPSRRLADGRRDSAPTVLLEILDAGCALIASDHSGAESLITSGQDGLLFPSDDLDGLCHALGALLDDPPQRRALAQRGRRRAAPHQWPVVARQLRAMLERL